MRRWTADGDGRYAWPLAACAVALVAALTRADASSAQGLPDIRVSRASVPPKIDGDLSDTAWEDASPLNVGEWISYNPLRGEKTAPVTEVRIVYDERYLYFAFHCFDSEPDR